MQDNLYTYNIKNNLDLLKKIHVNIYEKSPSDN